MTEYIGGFHAVRAALKSSAGRIDRLYVRRGRRDQRLRDLKKLAGKHNIECEELGAAMLNDLVDANVHQGVVVRLLSKSGGPRPDLKNHLRQCQSRRGDGAAFVLILDGVQDPHNLGACLRSADAAGVDAVVVPVDNSPGLTSVVRKVASGAAETVAFFQETSLQRAIADLQSLGLWVFGAAGEARKGLYQMDLTVPVALVMGSEGKGLRRLTRERCDELFHLPMSGSVTSLNVSVAAGICLFEAVRQRALSTD